MTNVDKTPLLSKSISECTGVMKSTDQLSLITDSRASFKDTGLCLGNDVTVDVAQHRNLRLGNLACAESQIFICRL